MLLPPLLRPNYGRSPTREWRQDTHGLLSVVRVGWWKVEGFFHHRNNWQSVPVRLTSSHVMLDWTADITLTSSFKLLSLLTSEFVPVYSECSREINGLCGLVAGAKLPRKLWNVRYEEVGQCVACWVSGVDTQNYDLSSALVVASGRLSSVPPRSADIN